MILKGTRKIKGGDNKILEDKLFELFKINKNTYLKIFLRETNIQKFIPFAKYVPKSIVKKYIGISVNPTDLVQAVQSILKYLEKTSIDQELFQNLYNIYKSDIEKLYSKYKRTSEIDEKELNEMIKRKSGFLKTYDFILSKVIEEKQNGNIIIADNIIENIRLNEPMKQKFLETYENINPTFNKNEIKQIFQEISRNDRTIDENEKEERKEDEKEERKEERKEDGNEEIKKKKKLYNNSGSILAPLINSRQNIRGPLLSTTSFYDKAYSSKKKPNKLVLDLERLKDEFELSKSNIDRLNSKIDKYNEMEEEESRTNMEYKKLTEERNKNKFNMMRDIANMAGNFTNNLMKNTGHFTGYTISTINNYFKTFGNIGQGIFIKLFVLILAIIAIFVGYYHFSSIKDANSMSFMNMNNKFLMFNNTNDFTSKFNEYIKGILPFSAFNSINVLTNNITYATTGQNIYDKYLIPREEAKEEGRCDNIFHINYKSRYGNINTDKMTFCTIKPKDIIINYNDNNYLNSDYNKLDDDLKKDLDYYKYYYIPVIDNANNGKYDLDITNSTFNNNPTINLNQKINNTLSGYKLFKYNNNVLTLNKFNNNANTNTNIIATSSANANVLNNRIIINPTTNIIDSKSCYSAYGIYLVNPNYSGLNIAIIDIDFNYDKFNMNKFSGLTDLNQYISYDEYKKNIFYIKINAKNPNYIYVTNDENDMKSDVSIFDFMNMHNNISILKLYNQVNGLQIYDLKYTVPPYNLKVIPPKLKYDNENKRFYIDFVTDGENTSYLAMDKAINGSINPIYEISVNANDLNRDDHYICDNYFLLFPSLNDDSLFRSDVTNQELTDIILNFQNTQGDQINYTYHIGIDTRCFPIIKRMNKQDIGLQKMQYFYNNNYYYKNSESKINSYIDELYNTYMSANNLKNDNDTKNKFIKEQDMNSDKLFITYAFLLYFIMNYFSRCIFYINLYDYNYGKDGNRTSYSIYLISNDYDGGNTQIFGPKSGLGGQDYGEWTSNKIFRIDMSKYNNLKTNGNYYRDKSIQSIGSSSINFKNSQIYNYFDYYKNDVHSKLMNSDKLLEKNLYFKEPKSFIGKLYTLIINRYE